MPEVDERFGSGGAHLVPKGGGKPGLATVLRGLIDDIGNNQAEPAWSDELAVTTHQVTLAAGWVAAVEATTATSAGVKQMQYSGTPSAGLVQVTYASGVATLTFNATDAVTGCRVMLLPYAAPTITKG